MKASHIPLESRHLKLTSVQVSVSFVIGADCDGVLNRGGGAGVGDPGAGGTGAGGAGAGGAGAGGIGAGDPGSVVLALGKLELAVL
ncbi:unnamed protein product, partial [Closterium sp. NIES-53]